MSPIEFDAQITNGTIEIPTAHRGSLQGDVHVIVFFKDDHGGTSKIDELLRQPLIVPEFHPLTRDEAHERS